MSFVKLIAVLVIIGALALLVLFYAAVRDVVAQFRRNPQRLRLVWLAGLALIALAVLFEILRALFK
jgi:NADH:ubiquinone oxidoreductase subunit 6 (subunit J)